MEPNASALVDRCRRDELGAFEELVDQHKNPVLR
jgi:hypothetical protein